MKRIIGFTCVILSILLAGCIGNSPRQEEQKASAELNTPSLEQVPPQTPREDDDAVHQRKERERNERIAEIRAVFVGRPSAKDTETPKWKEALRGKQTNVCELRARCNSLNESFSTVSNPESGISWTNIGVEMGKASELRKAVGIQYLKELHRIYSLPFTERMQIEVSVESCGGGEGGLHLEDGGRLLGDIEYNLQEAGLKPDDIGTSSEKLRQLLLADYVHRIAHMRDQIAKNKASESDGMGAIISMAKDAIQEWKFTPDELQLTELECNSLKF